MITIYKYTLQIRDVQHIEMPAVSEVLSVQVQGAEICAWAMVNTDTPFKEFRTFHIFGTGNPIGETIGVMMRRGLVQFVGTVQTGSLVWHVFVNRL